MRANPLYRDLDPDFWAHVRSLSQSIGYTNRKTQAIKVPDFPAVLKAMQKLGLDVDHLVAEPVAGAEPPEEPPTKGKRKKKPVPLPSDFAKLLLAYFSYRADVLETARQMLMNKHQAEEMCMRILAAHPCALVPAMNKQSGDKKKVAYLTAMVNALISAHSDGIAFDHNPQKLTTVTVNKRPVRTLARRVDGAFPTAVNPLAVWEIKEYYHTTSFGSRVADGVYETLLDGMELAELREKTDIKVEHLLIIDAIETWWDKGRSYLCRIVDVLNMGYVDEVLFGREIETALPRLAARWVSEHNARLAGASPVTPQGEPVPEPA